jgi:hypothetical protein
VQAADAAVAADAVAGKLWRAHAALLGRADSAAAVGWARALADQAIVDADGGLLRQSSALIVALHAQGQGMDKALEEVTALHQAVLDAHGDAGTGVTSVTVAEVAIRAGRLQAAQEASALARVALDGHASLSHVAWLEGWVAYLLGESEALETARDAASGGHQEALDAFVSLSEGLPPTELGSQITVALSDWELALFHTEFAQLEAGFAAQNLRAAISAADKSGARDLQVYTRLAAESASRMSGAMDAAALRAGVRGLFQDEVPANLEAELLVRAILDGETQELPAGGEGVLGVWAALTTGTAPPEGGEDVWYSGLSSWAQGRSTMKETPADATAAFQSALGAIPAHRQGSLRIGTVLDGSQGIGLGPELVALEGVEKDETLELGLLVHELAHRYDEVQSGVLLGRDMTLGVAIEQRQSLRSAVARARVEVLQFMLGGPFPDGIMGELAQAEAVAAEELPFKRVTPTDGMSLSDLRNKLENVCLVSYVEVNGRVSGLAISPSTGILLDIGSAAEVNGLMSQYRTFLEGSAEIESMGKNPIGNNLRVRMVDPLANALTGFGNYLFLSGDALSAASLITFPEQAASLRYLADIRTMSHGTSLRSVFIPFESEEAYEPEFLGLGNPIDPPPPSEEPEEAETEGEEASEASAAEPSKAKGGKAKVGKAKAKAKAEAEPEIQEVSEEDIPVDMAIVARHFTPPFLRYQIGEEATEEGYLEHALTARYLYISTLSASADGGFQLVGDELTLSEVRANPMMAEVVFINAPAPHALQMNRVRAFLDAGATAVVVVNWEIPDNIVNKLVDAFHQAAVQGRELPLALADARASMLKDRRDRDEDFTDNPALWGALTLHGSW